jgi:catechol 2,3-dioxygenase-like lactoylglutathione lyase family enzyme
MQIQDLYTIIVTDKLIECRDFYRRWFGFQVVFEASWFIYMVSAGERSFAIAFMANNHPSDPPGSEIFNGQGAFLTFQVADAAAEYDRLQQADLKIEYILQDEPWGQRRFGLHDPAGTWIDVVQQIEPNSGYWEQYMQ